MKRVWKTDGTETNLTFIARLPSVTTSTILDGHNTQAQRSIPEAILSETSPPRPSTETL